MNPNDALIQKAMSSMVSHFCLYSFCVVAARTSLHARRITTNFLHTRRGLYIIHADIVIAYADADTADMLDSKYLCTLFEDGDWTQTVV